MSTNSILILFEIIEENVIKVKITTTAKIDINLTIDDEGSKDANVFFRILKNENQINESVGGIALQSEKPEYQYGFKSLWGRACQL